MKLAVLLFTLVLTLGLSSLAATANDKTLPRAADLTTLVQGNNTFALALFGRLRKSDGNLFYSPYSISTALAMTRAGARGETARQMDQVLHFSLDADRLHPAFAELNRLLNDAPRDYQLQVAQSLWGDASLVVRPEFQDLLDKSYGAGLRQVDFARHSEEARQKINHWVEDKTKDKIKDLLHRGDIDARTRMVLVNAIYFKADWQHPFNKQDTQKDGVFHAGAKDEKVPLMRQTEHFRYAEEERLQVLELPYGKEALSMVLLLPRDKDGLAKVERELTPARLERCLGKLASRRVELTLPRFKVEARFNLADELKALGMPLAFSGAADFSGMSSSGKLMISKVIHQAFVDVHEEGTEAAAATVVIHGNNGKVPRPPVPFRADHPFLFLLRDRQTGSILFLGRLADPAAGSK
jgi:serpin B